MHAARLGQVEIEKLQQEPMVTGILIIILSVTCLVLLLSGKRPVGASYKPAEIEEVCFGLSGYGLFCLFGPPHEGIINLWPL